MVLNTRRDDSEFHAEYDPLHTVEAISDGIRSAGHDCLVIEGDEEAPEKLRAAHPDLVFNRAEGIRGESRESHIPAILEMLGIPYVGSGVLSLALCLNKRWTNLFLRQAGVRTPASDLVETEEDLPAIRPDFPVILKPNGEGSSIGINEDNVVRDLSALRAKARLMMQTYRGPILVEQFIPGREISVGVLGKDDGTLEILPFLEVDFSRLPREVGNVFGRRAKSTYDDLSHYLCPAPVKPPLAEALRDITLTVCRTLRIRDFGRVDFRIGDDGVPCFLEINPLPGMDYDTGTKDFSFFIFMAMQAGLTYRQIVDRLLRSALARTRRR